MSTPEPQRIDLGDGLVVDERTGAAHFLDDDGACNCGWCTSGVVRCLHATADYDPDAGLDLDDEDPEAWADVVTIEVAGGLL